MTGQRDAAVNARGRELMAELRILRARARRGKTAHVRRLQRLRRDAETDVAEAEAILAALPREPDAVTAARRAVLAETTDLEPEVGRAIGGRVGSPAWAVRAAAEAILRQMPPDPDAAAHREVLLAAVKRR